MERGGGKGGGSEEGRRPLSSRGFGVGKNSVFQASGQVAPGDRASMISAGGGEHREGAEIAGGSAAEPKNGGE